ncbi:ubiquinone/menaquinone biosynthesis methyltransferase [Leifsonia xyli subsp. cynodontis DSM 46306]|uniref:Demethylmenaquinone methyltransferase n=1 Tax=Leifsonia xyli subsp. cynodontis DSM 46306 TaxID=1389489 RepID=U3P413_LEIXC|nr:ubiquinone/menaquinone biosynthesis methyltransferase [Leifsonia xyli subsp. cynodontis DSM 46306]
MVSKADLSKQPVQVAAMFDEVSTHYDRTNAVLSMGNAALWRTATTRAVGPLAGETILDIAAGTGTSSASLARNGARVVAADFSQGMIEVGRRRQAGNPFVTFQQADATDLPFPDDTFDAVTISFGLRNIVDPRRALAEFYRVTKPGGRVVICEFSHPPVALIRSGYTVYLRWGMPVLARVASSNPAAYEYLMDSIQAWPEQPELAAWLREAGYQDVAWRNLTAGIVALHRGWKPLTAKAVPAVEESVPEKPVPEQSVPQNSAPGEFAPDESVRGKPAPDSSAAATSATAKPATQKSARAKSETATSESVKPSPRKSTSAESAAAKPATAAAPAKLSTRKSAPAKPTVNRSTDSAGESSGSVGRSSGRGAASGGDTGSEYSSSAIPPGGEQ